jgi:hypothetical protein
MDRQGRQHQGKVHGRLALRMLTDGPRGPRHPGSTTLLHHANTMVMAATGRGESGLGRAAAVRAP